MSRFNVGWESLEAIMGRDHRFLRLLTAFSRRRITMKVLSLQLGGVNFAWKEYYILSTESLQTGRTENLFRSTSKNVDI